MKKNVTNFKKVLTKSMLILVLFSLFSIIAKAQTNFDIKPGSCPNPLNVKSNGVLPVAILGTATFDVNDIDVSTLEINGVSPIKSSIEDVAAPVALTPFTFTFYSGSDSYFFSNGIGPTTTGLGPLSTLFPVFCSPDPVITFSGNPACIIAKNPAWVIISGTQWVSDRPDGTTSGPSNGTVISFDVNFFIPSGTISPTLTVDVIADDNTEVLLNGTNIGTGSGFQTIATISTSNAALFNTGATPNILRFDVIQLAGDGFGFDYKATVSWGDVCACTTAGPDGFDDLSLKFNTQDIVATLGSVCFNEQIVLTITGELNNGTPFSGADCIIIKGAPKCLGNPGSGFLLTPITKNIFPNPSSAKTNIQFSLDQEVKATLKVYNVMGLLVTTLFDEVAEENKTYNVEFDVQNLPDGIYSCILTTESGEVSYGKIMIVK